MERKILYLAQIDLQDERFRTSYFFPLEKLVLSIKNVGLIHPPLVCCRDNSFILVSGWKRVFACRVLSLSPIEVFVLESESDLKTFLTGFYENYATREFSLVEKSEILLRLKKFGEQEMTLVKRYLPLLRIPPTHSYLDVFLALSEFEPAIKKAIYEKSMPFATVELLVEFSSEEQKIVLPLLSSLGQNKQKEILENLLEISRRKDIPAGEVLNAPEVQEILKSSKMSQLQKAEKARLVFKKKRFPRLTAWRESFDSSLKKVHWPRSISVQPSPSFEEDTLSLTFHFKNLKEFRAHLSMLENLASTSGFSSLFQEPSDD